MNHERPRLRGSGQAGPSGNAVERIERFTEVPMLVLAIAYVPAFAVELLVKVAVADRGLSYLRSHWPEVLIVVLPFLRPLRVLLVLPFLIRAVRGLERILGPYKAAYVLVLWLLTVFTGAGLVLLFEEGSGGTINGFWDALWWAVTTITTVGYGDTYPVTFAGRVVAIVVMLVGIILFGVLTAGVAAYFVERVEERDEGEQTHKLDLVLKRLDEQEERNKKVDLLLERLEEIEKRLEGRDGRSGGD
jgi:voltage-gated potassium channel